MKNKIYLGSGLVKIYAGELYENTCSITQSFFFNTIPNKMVSNLNVFFPGVKYWVLCEVYGASVIIFYQDGTKINSVITSLVFHLDILCTTATCINELYLICG